MFETSAAALVTLLWLAVVTAESAQAEGGPGARLRPARQRVAASGAARPVTCHESPLRQL